METDNEPRKLWPSFPPERVSTGDGGLFLFMTYQFDVQLAEEFGVNAAIMLQNLAFWIASNRANGRSLHEGKTWTYNSIKAFGIIFPFWNDRQIRYILDDLVKRGVLITGNFNKAAFDRTLWYAFAECFEYLSKISGNPFVKNGKSNGHSRQMDSTEMTDLYQIENKDIKPDERRASRFTPPSMLECREYAASQELPEDEGESFWNHHDARGWMLGKVKMKNWHSAFATWKKNFHKFNPSPVAGKTGRTAREIRRSCGVGG